MATKKIASMVTAAITMSGLVTALTAAPAAAADDRCLNKYGSAWNAGGRPQWIGAVGATKARGTRIVAEMSVPTKTNGEIVKIWQARPVDEQLWCFQKEGTSGGYSFYQIRNLYSGLCIDVVNSSKTDGAKLHQWGCFGPNNGGWAIKATQQWRFVPLGTTNVDGGSHEYHGFVNMHSEKVMDVAGYATTNGSYLHQWTWNNTSNQHWF